MNNVSCFPPGGGKPRLLSAQCATCIYRPGNLMRLEAGRLAQMTFDALRQGSQGVICHDTLPYGGHPRFGPAMCRGFYDRYAARSNFIRVISRIGGFTVVDPPGGTK